MSLFSNMMGFGRPGPGVRPDEPRKKGMLRLLEILSRDMWSFFRAGFLALVSFIPFMVLVMLAIDTRALIFVLAAGLIGGPLAMPQIVGLADTVLRSLRDEPGYWWVTYRRAWKRNLKACVVPGILCGLLLAMQVFLFFILLETGTSSPSWVATIVGFFITLGLTFYIVPQLALVDLPLLGILKNSLLLFIAYFPRTLGSMLVMGGYWALYLLFYPLSPLVLVVTNFWLPVSITLLILYIPLDKSFHIEENIKKIREEDARRRRRAGGRRGVTRHRTEHPNPPVCTQAGGFSARHWLQAGWFCLVFPNKFYVSGKPGDCGGAGPCGTMQASSPTQVCGIMGFAVSHSAAIWIPVHRGRDLSLPRVFAAAQGSGGMRASRPAVVPYVPHQPGNSRVSGARNLCRGGFHIRPGCEPGRYRIGPYMGGAPSQWPRPLRWP